MTRDRLFAVVVIAAVTMFADIMASRAAVDVTEFYTGKTIKFVIGVENGAYARAIGRHLVKYMPGNPSIQFKKMTGAGGHKAVSTLYKLAPGDGLTIGAIVTDAIMTPLVGAQKNKSKLDPRKFKFLGSASRSVFVCIADRQAPATTFAEAIERPLLMGANVGGGITRDSSLMLMNLVGARFKLVQRYRDTAQILRALRHGEIDGFCGYGWSALKHNRYDLVVDKKINILLQFSLDGHSELTRQGVPNVWDFVNDPKDRAALGILASSMVIARPFVAPPATPRAQINALRVAFERTMKDVDFRSDARKSNLNITPTTGEAVQKLVEKIYKTPPEIVARARAARKN